MPSVLLVTYDTTTGKYLVQQAGTAQIANASITSALIAAGAVGTPHIANQSITSALIGAGAVGTPHIANQSITSALIAANAIATPHIANQGILSASIGTNIVGAAHIQNQGLASANYGAGSIGNGHVADYGIVSGKIASGAIGTNQLASGISITIAETIQESNYRAQGIVSAYMGVQFSASGYFNLSQAGAISSLPVIGLATANINSGQIGTVQTKGPVTNTGWNFSGYFGCLVFVDTSSAVTVTAPSASGNCIQRLGKVITGTTVYLTPDLQFVQLAQ
jgi:hypothetical protein